MFKAINNSRHLYDVALAKQGQAVFLLDKKLGKFRSRIKLAKNRMIAKVNPECIINLEAELSLQKIE
jgi:hypothetical protein